MTLRAKATTTTTLYTATLEFIEEEGVLLPLHLLQLGRSHPELVQRDNLAQLLLVVELVA